MKALRSGEYEQGHGQLCKDGKKWCCLGVLCNLPEVPGEWVGDGYKAGRGPIRTGTLPGAVRNQVELSGIREEILIDLNDNKRINFKEIADWIEKNL